MTFCKSEKTATKKLFEKARAKDYKRLIECIKNQELVSDSDVWQLRDMLNAAAREFDAKYDYRYSVMLDNFVTFVLEGLIALEELEFLSQDKYQHIEKRVQSIHQFQKQFKEIEYEEV